MIPLPITWNLRVPAKEKARVITIFALGIITMSVSIARFVTINIVLNITSICKDQSIPFPYFTNWPLIDIFSAAEINIALIVAALPTLNLFFKGKRHPEPRRVLDSERTGSSEVSKSPIGGEFCTAPLHLSATSLVQGRHSDLSN